MTRAEECEGESVRERMQNFVIREKGELDVRDEV